MYFKHDFTGRCRWNIAIAASLCVLLQTAVRAQTFEYVYGDVYSIEWAYQGVVPVNGCTTSGNQSDGYVAAGATFCADSKHCDGRDDIYLVRTTTTGAHMWEKTYALGGTFKVDEAASVRQLSDGGFIVVGTTASSATSGGAYRDIFLLKVDCDGTPVWAKIYSTGFDSRANDIIVANTYTANNPYDFVICGYTRTSATTGRNAFLIRTDASGAILWDAQYDQITGLPTDPPDRGQWFNSLIEAAPTAKPGGGLQTIGDIIAVGCDFKEGSVPYGYVVRVDGTTGLISTTAPLLQNAADYGGSPVWTQEFYSVAQLKSLTQSGNVVVSGNTSATNPLTNDADIYLIKNNGDPCTLLADRVLTGTYPGTGTPSNDFGVGIRELQNAMGSLNAGDLVLTGRTDQQGSSFSTDAFAIAVNSTNLGYIANSGNIFGDFASKSDGGTAIEPVTANAGKGITAGVIIAGFSQSNLEASLSPGDPEDMYLIKTNSGLATDCSQSWNPTGGIPTWTPTCMTPWIVRNLATASTIRVDATSVDWGIDVCSRPQKTIMGGGTENPDAASVPDQPHAQIAVRTYPNPVRSGGRLDVELSPSTGTMLEIRVMDGTGRVVRETTIPRPPAGQSLGIDTDRMASGTYTLLISDGTHAEGVRFVVVR
ncbi:MAG TPA: hypothetical protein VHI13_21665 [Candidatus Kapabacteria bacterium]|nr:hypothetical protein [Candidatus Kapabacteria bacterium]